MVAQFVAALERPVARVRLENYRSPGKIDDLDMVVNYFFNLELAEALYPSLQAFEVAFRNSIHATLSAHFNNDYWFDRRRFLPSWQRSKVADARKELTKQAKTHEHGRIVAQLSLGFWCSLFNTPFERNLWRPNRSALVGQVFPQAMRRQRNRQDMWDRVERIRIIRNRVMHYEPIWSRPHLAKDHQDIIEALRWISDDMHETIAMCDRFPTVLQNGRAKLEQRIQAEIRRRYPAGPQAATT